MIQLEKIPTNLPTEIEETGNPAIIMLWMLSKIFNYEFDLSELYIQLGVDNGIDFQKIPDYINKKGLYYLDAPEDCNILFGDYENLLQNDIVGGVLYTSYSENNIPHSSLITEFKEDMILLTYGSEQYYKINDIKGLYLFFISTRPQMKEFFQVKPNYSVNIGKWIKRKFK